MILERNLFWPFWGCLFQLAEESRECAYLASLHLLFTEKGFTSLTSTKQRLTRKPLLQLHLTYLLTWPFKGLQAWLLLCPEKESSPKKKARRNERREKRERLVKASGRFTGSSLDFPEGRGAEVTQLLLVRKTHSILYEKLKRAEATRVSKGVKQLDHRERTIIAFEGTYRTKGPLESHAFD